MKIIGSIFVNCTKPFSLAMQPLHPLGKLIVGERIAHIDLDNILEKRTRNVPRPIGCGDIWLYKTEALAWFIAMLDRALSLQKSSRDP